MNLRLKTALQLALEEKKELTGNAEVTKRNAELAVTNKTPLEVKLYDEKKEAYEENVMLHDVTSKDEDGGVLFTGTATEYGNATVAVFIKNRQLTTYTAVPKEAEQAEEKTELLVSPEANTGNDTELGKKLIENRGPVSGTLNISKHQLEHLSNNFNEEKEITAYIDDLNKGNYNLTKVSKESSRIFKGTFTEFPNAPLSFTVVNDVVNFTLTANNQQVQKQSE